MKNSSYILTTCLVLLSASLHAQTIWEGDVSTSWNTAGNWDTNSVPIYGNQTVVFDATGNQSNQPDLDVASAASIQFDNAGWAITGANNLSFLGASVGITNNATSGVNSINVNQIQNNGSSDTVYINAAGAGGTLVLGPMTRKSSGWNILGSGSIILNGSDSSTVSADFSAFSGTLLTTASGQYSGGSSGSSIIGSNASGSRIGGNGKIMGAKYGSVSVEGTLAAGGDGGYIVDRIGDLTLTSSNFTNRTSFTMASGSTLEVDIGTGGVGDNDRLLIDLFAGGIFTIDTGVTLSIVGSVIQDGTYTIATDIGTSSNFAGTFDTLLFNGIAADPSMFTVNYGVDAITVTVLNTIPEPGTFALLAGSFALAGVMMRRRR